MCQSSQGTKTPKMVEIPGPPRSRRQAALYHFQLRALPLAQHLTRSRHRHRPATATVLPPPRSCHHHRHRHCHRHCHRHGPTIATHHHPATATVTAMVLPPPRSCHCHPPPSCHCHGPATTTRHRPATATAAHKILQLQPPAKLAWDLQGIPSRGSPAHPEGPTQGTPLGAPQSVPSRVSPQCPTVPIAPTPEIGNKAALSPLSRVSVPRPPERPRLIIPRVSETSLQLKNLFFFFASCAARGRCPPLQPPPRIATSPSPPAGFGPGSLLLSGEGHRQVWVVTHQPPLSVGDTPKQRARASRWLTSSSLRNRPAKLHPMASGIPKNTAAQPPPGTSILCWAPGWHLPPAGRWRGRAETGSI